MEVCMNKEQFLTEHNRLSPLNLQATFALLTQFQEESKPFLKDADWSFKLRISFITWLLARKKLSSEKKKYISKSTKQEYKIYPQSE